MTEFRSNGAVLREFVPLEGARVLDIGSGDGTLVRYMTKHGATVTGLECGAAQLEKARSHSVVGNEVYVEGVGQDLPFGDSGFDVAVFFNSLHHVPPEFMDAALTEAARVVKPSGAVYVAEPLAEGPSFIVHAPVDDETEVRALADQALRRADGGLLTQESVYFYANSYHYEDFEAMRDESIRIGPERAARFEEVTDEVRALFEEHGVLEEKGWRFDQPMRVNLLRKS